MTAPTDTISLRPSQERGYANHGWLKTHHSFSFAQYYDPQHMGWGNLRVINEDFIAPDTGFGMHPHRDMEIVTYVLSGALAHRDSMGNHSTIGAGEVQRMSAGRGVQHSEVNAASQHGSTHLLQIWVQPKVQGIAPEYEQKAFDPAAKRARLCPIATPDGQDGSLAWHADARLYAALLDGDDAVELPLSSARLAYVHVVRGQLVVNGVTVHGGDAVRLQKVSAVTLAQAHDAEVLLFDLAP
ncbi:MAG: pirin family protein [Rhodoferax sp.]